MSALAGTRSSLLRHHGDLVSLLLSHSEDLTNQTAYSFLLDAQNESVLTYSQLDQRARAVAAHLRELGLAGQRVLLAYPPGLDFIIGFFGCLYAGCIAVPTHLPRRRTLDRFHAVLADSWARLVMSTASAVTQHQATCVLKNGQFQAGSSVPWLATDEIPDGASVDWKPPPVSPETLAMLQYTSGSTSRPKGVMLSHDNLIHNTRAICEAFSMGQDTGVFWLPTSHDMGLVGGVLAPMLAGRASVLMAPATFLRQPFAWLAAVSKYRATISGGPNFAYDLCVRKVTDEQRATLDLSCWSLAFVGAEPIQPETLERFAAAFAPCGFDPAAFYPCYGLAEATLMVSGAVRASGPTVRAFHEQSLARNQVECVPDGSSKSRQLVSCGSPVGDLSVVIVDSSARAKALPGCVGEIWVAGASVGQGYWHNADQTLQSFNAHLSDADERPFLRTGDLGFVFEGQLFVTGRQDDLLIVRGVNHYPQDMETTARRSHRLLEAGYGSVFAVNIHGGQQLVLVHEVARNGTTDFSSVLAASREAVLEEHGVALHTVVLVRCGTIPRTSSGKVQRRACRAAFLALELEVLAAHDSAASDHPGGNAAVARGRPCVCGAPICIASASPCSARSSVLATVCQHALALGGASLSDVAPDMPLAALGLDSLQRVELAATLEQAFACRVPDAEFNSARTLGELADAVQKHLNGNPQLDAHAGEVPPAHYDFARFPEFVELKCYERMLKAVAGENPYFRVDNGGSLSGGVMQIAGRELINFSIYDYVGLARHHEVATAAKSAIDRYGVSAGASRLVSGEKQVHRDLEQALAGFLGTAAAIVFVSGYATNVTAIGHLLGPEDLVVYDALAHNSIMQGAQLSGATRRAFAHNDWRALDKLLSEVRHRYRRVLIAIEGVYSMDGDYPDLPRFVELKQKHKALILVDEAHSLGTLGATGRGLGEHWGVARTDVDLWMGTLSKSLASCGGYIAGSAELIEYLAYTAPGFVYSVGLSPPNAAAALAAITVLQAQPQRVARLRELAALFLSLARERGLNTGSAAVTPVIPVIVGNSVKTLRLARVLFERGINVQPILHPAVPERSARLRFFITTNHSEAQIRDTVSAVADELNKL